MTQSTKPIYIYLSNNTKLFVMYLENNFFFISLEIFKGGGISRPLCGGCTVKVSRLLPEKIKTQSPKNAVSFCIFNSTYTATPHPIREVTKASIAWSDDYVPPGTRMAHCFENEFSYRLCTQVGQNSVRQKVTHAKYRM